MTKGAQSTPDSGSDLKKAAIVIISQHGALPPVPWSYLSNDAIGGPLGAGRVYLIDAGGRKIANIWGNRAEKIALAETICDLVNQIPGSAPQ